MALGPLELMIMSFPADRLNDGVLTTLDRLTRAGEMRIVDVLVVRADAAGVACTVELCELPGLSGDLAWARLATGLITATDVEEVARLADHETDVLAVLLEHRWVNDLAGRVAASRGTIVALNHIPGAPGHGRVLTSTR
ncbi:hypothetical protein ACWT_3848 [Actinoplanes sp. SE50]|uniref:DUF6325 family protein n=1 Tax=unclassified Actinoplanes TaxID=2626549 RepID=UPI00023ECEA8|nr:MULTISPECIES: DUF6325 family protein [unclassified Actinoplanes]AEV84872.1 hypothetical protein ACPL_3977 [Actinoplanes sp. SE50/110]ATO83263.1 hypothetical protein ACWT_3848 [Actinoplanes sp. SE50]SLM00670.1 hypothetical protein ACSP50_3903 [Actinoplanes sp. SE50/110]